MTQVGKAKLDHPALGTAGGGSLHAAIETLFTNISDHLPGRWKLYSSVANGDTVTYEHGFQVPLSDLRVHIYTSSAGVQTRVSDLSGWTLASTGGFEQSKIDITVPSSGGPYTFYLFISHEPMSDKLSLSGGTMTGDLVLSADPDSAMKAVTKQYVDNLAQGLDVKASVKAASTANVTLTGEQTIDGVSLVAGDRVLLKNQTTQSQNGIYIVDGGGWTRAADMDSWGEVPGAFCFVEEGTTNADTGWVCSADVAGTIGTTAMTWSQFAGVGSNASTANDLAPGSVLAIEKGGTGQTTANAALNALLPSQTSQAGKLLSTNGTSTSWESAATLPSAGTAGSVYSNGSSFTLVGSFSGKQNNLVGVDSSGTSEEYKSISTGTSGLDFNVSHSAGVVSFNIPDAASNARGLVTTGSQTFAGNKTFSGSVTAQTFVSGYNAVTSATTLDSTHSYVSATGASTYAITLPSAVGITGRTYTIKSRMNAGVLLTVNTTSSQTIDGATSVTLARFESLQVISNNSNWEVF